MTTEVIEAREAPETAQDVADDIAEVLAVLAFGGPHPIFDALIAEQPEDGYVRRLFGLGHRHELPVELPEPVELVESAEPVEPVEPVEPDAIHDPPTPRTALTRLLGTTRTIHVQVDLGARG